MLMSALRDEGGEITDSDALLALYQASYLAFPGDTVLDQARAFAVGKLAARDDSDFCTHLSSTLPLHWRAPRLQAMWSLIKDDDHNNKVAVDPAILQLAQVDFNLVQALHRRELAEVTTWWKESRLGEYSFARDRVVECFFCAACIAPEPRLAECREVLAKTGALIDHLDDIYDVYGTPDELQAFTDAIASWEHCDDGSAVVMDMALPEYMKAMYSAIWTTSATAADRVLNKHGYDMLPLYKKVVSKLLLRSIDRSIMFMYKFIYNWEVAAAASGPGGNDPCCSSSSSSSATETTESTTSMTNLCLNLARIVHCIYQDGDGITSPTHRMKQMVKDLLFNPIHHVL